MNLKNDHQIISSLKEIKSREYLAITLVIQMIGKLRSFLLLLLKPINSHIFNNPSAVLILIIYSTLTYSKQTNSPKIKWTSHSIKGMIRPLTGIYPLFLIYKWVQVLDLKFEGIDMISPCLILINLQYEH